MVEKADTDKQDQTFELAPDAHAKEKRGSLYEE